MLNVWEDHMSLASSNLNSKALTGSSLQVLYLTRFREKKTEKMEFEKGTLIFAKLFVTLE